MVGVNNVLDAIFPSFAVGIVTGYYYSAIPKYDKIEQRKQSAFYREVRAMHITLKHQNVHTNSAGVNEWNPIFIMPKYKCMYNHMYINDSDSLSYCEWQIIKKSYDMARITFSIAISHNKMFYQNYNYNFDKHCTANVLIRMFNNQRYGIIYDFINRRRSFNLNTNILFTISVEECCIIQHDTPLHIVHMYKTGDIDFIRAFAMRYFYKNNANVSMSVRSGQGPMNDMVTIV
jgi:hypothetical protein